jgi:Lon protease-like protein
MADDGSGTRLPLFPLPDVVHFPRTDLRLHVFESRYRRLLRELAAQEDEEPRWIGMVLVKPGHQRPGCPPEIYPGGTAGRLVELEPLPDGGSNILLRGELRFQLERELDPAPYRQALVRLIEEPVLNERDAGIVAVKSGLVELANDLAAELGERFPVSLAALLEVAEEGSFEELVNRIAAELDLPAPRKFSLLAESLPDRALSLVSILRSRKQVIDLLRPYRPLAAKSEWN